MASTSTRRGERGQATTETIMLTWILLVFMAATYQVFLMNETIYRSATAVHAQMFKRGFERNCYDDKPDCTYTTDRKRGSEGARVIWNKETIPEVSIRVVGMFERFGLSPDEFRLYSNYPGRPPEPSKGCPRFPCKKTKMGSGAYQGLIETLIISAGTLFDPEYYIGLFEDWLGALISIATG